MVRLVLSTILLSSVCFSWEYCEWKQCSDPELKDCIEKKGFMQPKDNADRWLECARFDLNCKWDCRPLTKAEKKLLKESN